MTCVECARDRPLKKGLCPACYERRRRVIARPRSKHCVCGASLSRFGPVTTQCRPCYQRDYRNRPGNREAHRRRVIAYLRANPDKRRRWVHTYLERIGWRNPDLTELRRTLRALEQALAQTARREGTGRPGQHGDDHGAEW